VAGGECVGARACVQACVSARELYGGAAPGCVEAAASLYLVSCFALEGFARVYVRFALGVGPGLVRGLASLNEFDFRSFHSRANLLTTSPSRQLLRPSRYSLDPV
jgi:hypothetical protein